MITSPDCRSWVTEPLGCLDRDWPTDVLVCDDVGCHTEGGPEWSLLGSESSGGVQRLFLVRDGVLTPVRVEGSTCTTEEVIREDVPRDGIMAIAGSDVLAAADVLRASWSIGVLDPRGPDTIPIPGLTPPIDRIIGDLPSPQALTLLPPDAPGAPLRGVVALWGPLVGGTPGCETGCLGVELVPITVRPAADAARPAGDAGTAEPPETEPPPPLEGECIPP